MVAATAAVFLGLSWALLLLRRWVRSRRARRRSAHALRGERRAESLLRARGYRILDRQVTAWWRLLCAGQEHVIQLRADLLVERRGRCYVAEVKTGPVAPRLDNPATRRQLLEYHVAYGVDGVLLVDAESREVQEVEFPVDRPATGSWALLLYLATAAGLGSVAGYLFRALS